MYQSHSSNTLGQEAVQIRPRRSLLVPDTALKAFWSNPSLICWPGSCVRGSTICTVILPLNSASGYLWRGAFWVYACWQLALSTSVVISRGLRGKMSYVFQGSGWTIL